MNRTSQIESGLTATSDRNYVGRFFLNQFIDKNAIIKKSYIDDYNPFFPITACNFSDNERDD